MADPQDPTTPPPAPPAGPPGGQIPLGGVRTVADGIAAWNPVFDVTPHALIDAIVTEQGVVEAPGEASMRAAFG